MDVWPVDSKLIRFVGEPYVTGEVDEAVFERLCELTQNPPQFIWPAHGGITRCNRCRFTGGGGTVYSPKSTNGAPKGIRYEVSATIQGVLWVPGDGFLWLCSRSITHYIDAHGFCPPSDFCDAVMRCPPLRSMEYLKAILANGGRELHFSGVKP